MPPLGDLLRALGYLCEFHLLKPTVHTSAGLEGGGCDGCHHPEALRSPVRVSIIIEPGGGTGEGPEDFLRRDLLRERSRACCLVVAPTGTGEALSSPLAVCVSSLRQESSLKPQPFFSQERAS